MPRKKSIELIQVTQSPKALIINGGDVTSYLVSTLKDQGCEVLKMDSYSVLEGRPAFAKATAGKFDYIFLFDNQSSADEIYEKLLSRNGKFIFIETNEKIPRPPTGGLGTGMSTFFHPRIKILKIGDISLWNLSQLREKILRTLFSSSQSHIDLRRKPTVSVNIKKENIPLKKVILPKSENNTLPIKRTEIDNLSKSTPPLLEKTNRFNIKKILLVGIFFIMLFIFIFIGISFWYLSGVKKTFANMEYHLKTANITLLRSDLKEADQEIKTIRKAYDFFSIIFFPFKNSPYLSDLGLLLDNGEQMAAGAQDLSLSLTSILPDKSGFGQATENLSRDKLIVLEKKVENFASILYKSQENMEKVSIPYFPKERIKISLSPILSQLTSTIEILPAVEKIFFTEGTKVYLVLLQNNMELRPTGGFIGSFGLLTVANGKIIDFKIEDVYTADGQLKGHVDPPLAIRKHLSQPNFFLRDSNFDPDFALSAVQSSWFLQKELGKDVDGVIALNLTLAQKLMQVVGPIKLTDFGNEEITGANFFYKVNYFSQDNFFPGSTQKKDILTGIANEILAKITGTGQINIGQLIPVIKQSLEEKNILFYFKDEGLQKFVEDRGWAGRMGKVACVARKIGNSQQNASISDSCFPDYLSIIEANLGVNKANYFINKSTIIEKKITSDGLINTIVTLSYENLNNTSLQQPQTYVNYMRVFVPVESKLVNVTLNNTQFSPSDIDTENYANDKTVFGFLVKIAPGNKGVVKITYQSPRPLSANTNSYQLFYQKQAGDKNSPLVFSLTYPSNFKFIPENFASSTARDYEIYYTTDTSVDRIFEMKRE